MHVEQAHIHSSAINSGKSASVVTFVTSIQKPCPIKGERVSLFIAPHNPGPAASDKRIRLRTCSPRAHSLHSLYTHAPAHVRVRPASGARRMCAFLCVHTHPRTWPTWQFGQRFQVDVAHVRGVLGFRAQRLNVRTYRRRPVQIQAGGHRVVVAAPILFRLPNGARVFLRRDGSGGDLGDFRRAASANV